MIFDFTSCKKDKITLDSGAKLQFSQDSILFDTVFTTIGSSTRNIRVRNKNNQRIKISSIQLQGGSASPFILNVDGAKGITFNDVEIAANDSLYIFIQVNVNPNNANSPLIINDAIKFSVNGNEQTVYLEAWGQDAYYHRPTDAIKFKDGSYLAYSLVSASNNTTVTWTNDKPHVIYGYLVVDSTQKLIINAGVRVFLNYKAGLWVYRYGELKVLGQKGNEVTFTGARREKEYADEPGQWDRIWINEGSVNNEINYAIIKNGYIGVQAEFFGGANVNFITEPRRLKITNTKIQNMTLWGFYGLGYNVYGGNNVFSNCQEHCVNIQLGGKYTFLHCTFANFWEKDNARTKPAININNYTAEQVLPLDSAYFGNCIIDGKLSNEINLDLDYSDVGFQPKHIFSNGWLKTTIDVSDGAHFINNKIGTGNLAFNDYKNYNFQATNESQIKGFTHPKSTTDVLKFPFDLNLVSRNTSSVTIGAYEN
ncbi:MAG: hypothetical protein Q7W45_04410 [Bacteroidota bacterium]|nr:hypothetical protein [Bacteroidota bacterium]MDP3144691.1 hypothetical protein [Bacteroidota bacterium]